jgi:hypothetical protein
MNKNDNNVFEKVLEVDTWIGKRPWTKPAKTEANEKKTIWRNMNMKIIKPDERKVKQKRIWKNIFSTLPVSSSPGIS